MRVPGTAVYKHIETMVEAGAPDDERLVLEARAGSRRAFETLVLRYQRSLYFLCLRYVKSHDLAADLSQRAFIKAMEKLHDLREARIFKSWLLTIGANLAANYLRDHARFVGDDITSVEQNTTPHISSQLETFEEIEALRCAIRKLPPKQRATLELRVYEELSFRDIAVTLDTTAEAAKVNFHYGVKRLRSLLVKKDATQLERV